MDGRAQAAYDVPTFDLYLDILSGGPLPLMAARAGQKLMDQDYLQIGNWISEKLREHEVWVVLMPVGESDKPFTRGLEYSPDWRIVYTDDKQKLFVDITTPKGAALYQGMFTGQTLYPNEYLANVAVGHNLLRFSDSAQRKRGLDHLVKALHDSPTPAPIKDMLYNGLRFPELQWKIDEVCRQYVRTFEENRAAYARQDGFDARLHTARWALARMEQVATATNDTQAAQTFRTQAEQCLAELNRNVKKW
jgi:hypothetical protein